ncbi:alginate lyase family protein [Puniceicoccaceae bacterium K14]|nr:alginate lyase family protein [Puniceicoccaceae bacterium K14]
MAEVAARFIHPGILHSQSNLDGIRDEIKAHDGKAYPAYSALASHPCSQSSYKVRGPYRRVSRRPDINLYELHDDANGAYQNALMWYFTGDIAHARLAQSILNVWMDELESLEGHDTLLLAALDGFKLCNAAEILRYTESGWSSERIKQSDDWFLEFWYPIIKDFASFANGNWDAAIMKCMAAIGVYTNSRKIFERAVQFYFSGPGNGSLRHYIVNESGQCQESSRDQAHCQFGLGCLAELCEIGWNQGLDLYGVSGDLLFKGFEYNAKYNLGFSVPYTPYLDRSGKYGSGGYVNNLSVISEERRGEFRPVFEMIENHYGVRVGKCVDAVSKVINRSVTESSAQHTDHPGFGSLLFQGFSEQSGKDSNISKSRIVLLAENLEKSIRLSWIGVADLSARRSRGFYHVARSDDVHGPFIKIVSGLSEERYVDSAIREGRIYHYVVSFVEEGVEIQRSAVASLCAGIPQTWRSSDIGNPCIKGSVNFDGSKFLFEASGLGIGKGAGNRDQLFYVYDAIEGNSMLTARIVFPVSSQKTKVGLMIRDSLECDSRVVACHLSPQLMLATISRSSGMGDPTLLDESNLSKLALPGYRQNQCFWIRIIKSESSVSTFFSGDGNDWQLTASVSAKRNEFNLIGLFACSGVEGITTCSAFDEVSLTS